MRNVLFVLGIFVASLLLSACPGDGGDAPPTAPPKPVTPPVAPKPVTPPAPKPVEKGEVEIIVSAPPTAVEGEEFEYSLVVRNRSRVDVKNVIVTNVLPASFAHVSSEPAASVTGPLLTWEFASLAPYAAEHLRVRVRTAAAGAVLTQATARADGGLVHEGRATIEVSGKRPAGAARLSLVLTCEPSVLVCDPITYRATVRNGGTVQATGLRVTGDLPEGLATRAGARSVAIDVGTLAAGAERALSYELLAQRTGSFTTTATLRGDGGGTATATFVVGVVRPLLVMLMDAPATAATGQVVNVRTTVRNDGDGAARDVRVQAELPAGTSFVSASDGGAPSAGRFVDWRIAVLEPGRSQALTLSLQGAAAGTIRSLATAEAYCADRASASARTQITETAPEFALSCLPSTDTAAVGDSVVYVIDVTNGAPQEANDVVVVCRIPPGQVFRSAEGPAGVAYRVAGDAVTFDPLASVPGAGGRVTYRVTTEVVAAGAEPFSAALTSMRQREPLLGEARVSASAPAARDVEVAVGAPETISRDDPFDCTIVVRNKGAGDARDVVVRTEFPAGSEYVSGAPTPTIAGAAASWILGTLRAGEARTLTLTVRPRSTGPLELYAEVAAAGNEPHRHSARTTVAERSALGVAVTCAESTLVCDPLTYRVVVTNGGGARLEGVRVRSSLPDGLLTDTGARDVDVLVGWVQPGASREVTFEARAERTGAFETVVQVSAASGELGEGRCTATVTRPVLEVTMAGPDESAPGESIPYTIAVRNAGDAAARDCVVEHPLPAETTFESASDGGRQVGGNVTWDLGVIEAGATKTVTLTLRATDVGAVTNTTTATGYCCEEATATKTTEVAEVPPTLQLSCTVARTEMRVGRPVECTITVANSGSTDAKNVVVICVLPPEHAAESASTGAGVTHTLGPRGVTFEALPVLAAGERAIFRVVVRATAVGRVRIGSIVRADSMEPVRAPSEEIRIFRAR